ncbi:hypothetical protein R3P38DRAFT_2778547 [Favolaschia claudopus]|uniref:Uncharacterized protein n=1 Tax=Favolaschia claudopus TaxID=2862362 RepID=A0AAW0BIN8_9AGAR
MATNGMVDKLGRGPPKRQMRRLLIVSRRLKQRQDDDDEKTFLQATETVWAAMRGHTEGGKMGGQRGNMVGGARQRYITMTTSMTHVTVPVDEFTFASCATN